MICMRLLETVESDLKHFFELFKGTVTFEVYGDSAIVLSQLLKDSWLFKQWVQLRVDEIQQLKKNMKQEVSFFHIPSGENKADILTRNHSGEPIDLPYDCTVKISLMFILYLKSIPSKSHPTR